MKVHKFLGGIGLVAALALTACGAGSEGGNTTGGGTAGGAAGSAAAGGGAIDVAADASGQLKFAQDTLSGAANQQLNVNFNNPSGVPHNWVLVQPGQENAVATAAAGKGGDPTGIEGVIAGGKPIASASETISVPAQPAGAYPYICTVPGHYQAGMRGTLNLQ